MKLPKFLRSSQLNCYSSVVKGLLTRSAEILRAFAQLLNADELDSARTFGRIPASNNNPGVSLGNTI
jgi:hypothetical protein